MCECLLNFRTKGLFPVPQLPILYEDNHLLVVNKPAGLLAQADRTGDPDVLTLGKQYIKRRYNKPGKVFLGLVHRLDRPASGVMVLARTSKAAQRLTDQFKQRTVDKRYLAIVEGHVGEGASWTDHIAKVGERPQLVRPSHPRGKPAVLSFSPVATLDGLSLVSVMLQTGRPHQIRLQFSSRGFPLVGDMRYGSRRRLDGKNLALHCFQLGLTHPTRKEHMHWQAEPPATWPTTFSPAIATALHDKSLIR